MAFNVSPLNARRLENFKANRRGFFSLWIFLALFIPTLFAEFIANDKPLLVKYEGSYFVPVIVDYAETTFGGDFPTSADYRDPFIANKIKKSGWMFWTPVRYSYDTINYDLPVPAPAPPGAENWLGTDDQGRDVVARAIYGFRISVLFGLTLTILSSVIGVAAGAVQGYFGGVIDLVFQRFIEIWGGLPMLGVASGAAGVREGPSLVRSWLEPSAPADAQTVNRRQSRESLSHMHMPLKTLTKNRR